MSNNSVIEQWLEAIFYNQILLERKLNHLLTEEHHMADALQEAFDALSAEVADTQAIDEAVATELQSLADQIKNIPPGTTVTPEQVQNLAATLTTATTALKSAADTASPPAAAPAVDPTVPATT